MSCAAPLNLRDVVAEDVRADPARLEHQRGTLEVIATLVEDARAGRWPRFAEAVLDLTEAMAVGLEGEHDEPLAAGRCALLSPRADVRVVVMFATDAARARATNDLRAIERILAAARTEEAAPAPDSTVSSAIAVLPLSPRMRDVARLVVAGRSDKEIATELGISHASARSYVQRMCRTLGVSGRGGVLRRVVGEPELRLRSLTPAAASGREAR